MLAPLPIKTETAAAESSKWSFKRQWPLLAIATLVAIAQLATLRPGHHWGDDFAMYIMEAQSLAEGRPITDTGYVPNPYRPTLSPIAYPPVFPTILAPVAALRGNDLYAFKLVGAICTLLLVALAYGVFAKYLAWPGRLALLAMLGLNPYLIEFHDTINSDVPFVAFVLASLLLIDAAYRAGVNNAIRTALLLISGATMYLAYGTRNLGIVLPAVLLGYDVIKRGWPKHGLIKGSIPSFAALTACAIFAAGYFTQKQFMQIEGSYFAQFSFDPLIPIKNISYYGQRLGGYFSNGYSKPIGMVLLAGLCLLSVIGAWNHLRTHGIKPFDLFVPAYMAPFAVWPPELGDTRYLLPLVPIFMFYVVRGAMHLPALRPIATAAQPGNRYFALAGVMTLVLVSYAARISTFDFGDYPQGIENAAATELFTFVRKNTAPEDIIVFTKPRAMALYAGRKSLVYADSELPEANEGLYDKLGVRLLIVPLKEETFDEAEDPAKLARYRDWLKAREPKLTQVFKNDDFAAYRWPAIGSADSAANKQEVTQPLIKLNEQFPLATHIPTTSP